MTELIDAVVEQTEKKFAATLDVLRDTMGNLAERFRNIEILITSTEERLEFNLKALAKAKELDALRTQARESGHRIEMRIATIEHSLDQMEHALEKLVAKIDPPPLPDPVLSKPVYELEISVRPHHCLELEGIKTIGDLVKKTKRELMRMPNFGKHSLREVEEALAVMNLQLRQPD